MKIACLSDLHVDVSPANRKIIPALVEELRASSPDALVLCGDVSPSQEELARTLACFSTLPFPRYFVAGNHDLWVLAGTPAGMDSFQKYVNLIPSICEENGFVNLGSQGHRLGDVGFAGVMGWFDFTFRNRKFDHLISMENYIQGRFRNLQWNDLRFTRWNTFPGYSDHVVDKRGTLDSLYLSDWMKACLRSQLIQLVGEGVRNIIVATHFFPCLEMIRYTDDVLEDFSYAFLGSAMLEELTADFPQISLWLCGHIHRKIERKRENLRLFTGPVGYLRSPEPDLQKYARECMAIIEM
jgi:predicted phosphohydrolase